MFADVRWFPPTLSSVAPSLAHKYKFRLEMLVEANKQVVRNISDFGGKKGL
jgi:hypothetical protein